MKKRNEWATLGWLIALHPRIWLVSVVAGTLSIVSDLFAAGILVGILNLLQSGASAGASLTTLGKVPFLDLLPKLQEGLEPRDRLYLIGGAILGLAVFRAGLNYIKQFLTSYHQKIYIEDLSHRCYSQLMNLPFIESMKRGRADLLNNSTRFTLESAWMVVLSAHVVGITLQLLAYLATIFAISSWVGIASCFVLALIMVGLNKLLMPLVQSRNEQANHEINGLTKWVLESVDGKIVFHSLGGLSVAMREFEKRLYRYSNALFGREKVRASLEPLMTFFSLSVLACLMVFFAWNAEAPEVVMPQIAIFVFLLTRLLAPASLMNDAIAQIRGYIDSANRVVDLVQEPRASTKVGQPFRGFEREVELQGVTFSYSDDSSVNEKKILNDISLKIPKRSLVAMVGSSGAGKSTLAKTLLRFLPPTQGRIMVDGVDAKIYSEDSWRRRIVYVPQDAFLLDDTIENNIRFGRDELTHADIERAAKNAFIHDFVESLPLKYQTPVGEAGGRLSGGQKQRIALARGLAGNPDLIILDETTSALDSESENAIRMTMNRLRNDCALLVIAHRLSTIVQADQIHFLEAGKIVESGTDAELVKQGGRYSKYRELQTL